MSARSTPGSESLQSVGKTRRLTVKSDGPLLACLLAISGLKRKTVKNLLKFGAVAVNGATVRQFDHPLAAGDVLTIGEMHAAAATSRLQEAGVSVLFEDDALIAVDKPSGLLTVATDLEKLETLFVCVSEYLHDADPKSDARAVVVHRLDQDTSGVVLFAKSELVKERLQNDWPSVQKTYLAVVVGKPPDAQGTIRSYLAENQRLSVYSSPHPSSDAKLAVTHYRLFETRGELSLLQVRLETGRKHQIRVHLADLGCRVAGDRRYGEMTDPCQRLGLHAAALALKHPLTGKALDFRSPLPAALGKWSYTLADL